MNRNVEHLKLSYAGSIRPLLLLFITLCLNTTLGNAQDYPPNIIFVICDQMRGDAIGALGNKNARTPNLDLLIENGVIFENNYANNPVCLPSRISMFSGKYPHQTGVLCNRHKGEWLKFKNSLPWYFKQAGYKTGYIGKNHTYIDNELSEFDVVNIRSREKFRAYSKYVPPYWHSDTFWPEKDCNPVKNTNEAIQFINRYSANQPFFLTVSYFDPHPPYMAPSQYTSRYCSEDMILPEYINPVKLGKRLAEHQKALNYDKIQDSDLKETLRYYHASVEWGVDMQVGRIVNALKDRGISDNTILVFTSDHGDFMGQHKMVRKGMFLYDALLHVPLIWYAPNRIKKGLRIKQLSQNVDIFPTLLELAGIDLPPGLAGGSLSNSLNGDFSENKDVKVIASASYSDLPEDYWKNPEPYFNPDSDVPFHTRVERITWNDIHRTMMIRTREWKLIISDTHEPELYSMDHTHTEKENLYGLSEYMNVFQNLKEELENHLKLLDKEDK